MWRNNLIPCVLLVLAPFCTYARGFTWNCEAPICADTLVSGGHGCAAQCAGGCDCSCGKGYLFGLIAPTNLATSDFISPMTNPVYFEDPRTLTEIRFIFAHHVVPNRAPLAGGEVQFLAAQLRAALTDRLSIIATKDGFFWFSDNLPFEPNDGWSDINVGLKYNLYTSDDYSQLLSAGLTYEAPWGSPRAYQGNGDGQFNLFATGGTRVGEFGHFITALGWKVPANSNLNSEMFYWSAHLDREFRPGIYGFVETNWYHYLSSGERIPGLTIEGGDLFNLGSGAVTGNDIVTGALGVKLKPTALQEIGFAWEVPLTDRRDVLEYRLTADWIIRY
jgi:hypothetical protein